MQEKQATTNCKSCVNFSLVIHLRNPEAIMVMIMD